MPELSQKTKQYHKQRVRSLMMQRPMITIEGTRRQLAHDGLPLDRHYIALLVKQTQTQRIKRADTGTLNMALAYFQHASAEIARVGWEIANDQMAKGRDRAVAPPRRSRVRMRRRRRHSFKIADGKIIAA